MGGPLQRLGRGHDKAWPCVPFTRTMFCSNSRRIWLFYQVLLEVVDHRPAQVDEVPAGPFAVAAAQKSRSRVVGLALAPASGRRRRGDVEGALLVLGQQRRRAASSSALRGPRRPRGWPAPRRGWRSRTRGGPRCRGVGRAQSFALKRFRLRLPSACPAAVVARDADAAAGVDVLGRAHRRRHVEPGRRAAELVRPPIRPWPRRRTRASSWLGVEVLHLVEADADHAQQLHRVLGLPHTALTLPLQASTRPSARRSSSTLLVASKCDWSAAPMTALAG